MVTHGGAFNSADVPGPHDDSATLLQVFSIAGWTVTGSHFDLLPQTKVPAPGSLSHRWIAPFLQSKCLFYRLRKEQKDRALRYAYRKSFSTGASRGIGSRSWSLQTSPRDSAFCLRAN